MANCNCDGTQCLDFLIWTGEQVSTPTEELPPEVALCTDSVPELGLGGSPLPEVWKGAPHAQPGPRLGLQETEESGPIRSCAGVDCVG